MRKGGAEGIRTPDPLTARLGGLVASRLHESVTSTDASVQLRHRRRQSLAAAINLRCQVLPLASGSAR
jgi:hypothetical protein